MTPLFPPLARGDGRIQQVFPVDLEGNRRVRRNPPVEPQDPSPPPDVKALEDLADWMDKEQGPDPEHNLDHYPD